MGLYRYIDVMIDRRVIEESILEQLIVQVRGVPQDFEHTEDDSFCFYQRWWTCYSGSKRSEHHG